MEKKQIQEILRHYAEIRHEEDKILSKLWEYVFKKEK